MNIGNWHRSFLYAVGVAAIVGVFVRPFDWTLAAFSLTALVFVCATIFMFLFTRSTIHLAFILPLGMTWLYFLAPYLCEELVEHSYRIIPVDYLPKMAFFSMLGVIALFAGYYCVLRKGQHKPLVSSSFRFSNQTLERLFYIFLFLGIAQRFIEHYAHWIYRPFGEVVQVFEFSQVLAVSIGLLYFLRKGRSPLLIATFFGFLAFDLLFRISDTIFSKVAYLLACLLLVYVIERRRIPWKTIVLILLILIPMFAYRKQARLEVLDRWYYGGSATISERIKDGFRFTIDAFKVWEWTNLGEELSRQEQTRFEAISYFGQCVYMVKECGKPLKYGETFWWMPLAVVPRAIFPWKPVNIHPSLLAMEYEVKKGAKGAANFPMLVEMFINFGFWGMVVLGFFQGAFTKWVLSKIAFGVGDFNLLAFINILWHLEKVESNITMILGGFLQVLITWWVIAKVFGLASQRVLKYQEAGLVAS